MNVDQLTNIQPRNIREPPVSQQRLMRESLEMDINLEHQVDEQLPLRTLETMGVGYGFDRLYVVDLNTGTRIWAPTRYDWTKLYRTSTHNHENYYGGMAQNSLWQCGTGAFGANQAHAGHNVDLYTLYTNNTGPRGEPWVEANNHDMALAYTTNGEEDHTVIGLWQNPALSGSAVHLDFNNIEDVTNVDGDTTNSILNRLWTGSAWDFITANADVIADLARNIQYLDKGLFQLYSRERTTSFARVRAPETVRLALALSELGHTIRRGRYSFNIAHGSATGTAVRGTYEGGLVGTTDTEITHGVINEFFGVFGDTDTHQGFLVAPWWLVNKLDTWNLMDEERNEEMQRDHERLDMIEALTLLFEAAETERGLAWGSDSTIPMLMFDKFKDGILKDMSDFTSASSSVAAQFLGFDNARDCYYQRDQAGIARIPYYYTLVGDQGSIIGVDKLEFQDRLAEHEKHTVTSPSIDNFKRGMALTASFEYSTMVTRTRFGDHHMDCQIYPFGFWRQIQTPCLARLDPGDSATNIARTKDNMVWFPLVSWSQLGENCLTLGSMRRGANGMRYFTSPTTTYEYTPNQNTDVPLWPPNYWRPGADNYTARVLTGLNQMYQEWTDRADTIRTEGLVGPTFGQISLISEMTYDTPPALIQRNFPFLRKMLTQPGISNIPVPADTTLDFMGIGNNIHQMSVWAGSTMFELEDRDLFTAATHPRTGSLELAPGILPLANPPENWVSIFQLRDALGFLTSLFSEPICDAFPMSTAASGNPSNGNGSARLTVYQANKDLDGRVRDVQCTPMLGVAGTDGLLNVYTNHRTGATYSMYPSSALIINNYTVFRLNPDLIREGTAVNARTTVGTLPTTNHGVAFPALQCDTAGEFLALDTAAGIGGTTLAEEDVVPGLYWQKLWLASGEGMIPQIGGRNLTWAEMWQDVDGIQGTTVGANIGYLFPVSTLVDNGVTGTPILTDLITWKDSHGRWIERVREELEYQHASPTLFLFDRDINDVFEAKLRATLYPLGMSTIGPLTFVGGMTAEGTSALTESITGTGCFEIIDLSLGAGASALESSDPDVDDIGTGEANPSMHIATKQDV